MRVSVRRGILLGVVGLAVAVACQKAEDKPGRIYPCTEDEAGSCIHQPPVGGVVEGGDAPADAPEASPDAPQTLTGAVYGLEDTTFANPVAYTGTATIYALNASGVPAQATYDGTSYVFHDAPYTTALWVKTEPQQGGPGAPYMPTIVPVDTTQGGAVDLPIIDGSMLDGIYTQALVTRGTGLAQVVLRVVGSTGKPVSGRSITSAAASVVIYSDNGSWNTTAGATDSAAFVILPNVAGGNVPVVVGGTQGSTVQAEANAVTFATLQVH